MGHRKQLQQENPQLQNNYVLAAKLISILEFFFYLAVILFLFFKF